MKIGFVSIKTGRRLNKREFLFVGLLIVIVEIYLLSNYILLPKWREYRKVSENYKNVSIMAEEFEKEYSRKGELEEKAGLLKFKIDRLSAEIPPYISREEIVLTIERYSKDENLVIDSITFENVTTTAADSFIKERQAESRDSKMVNEVNLNSTPKSSQSDASTSPMVLLQEVNLSFSGSYAALYNFLGDIEKNPRKVIVKGLEIRREKGDVLKGNIKIAYIAYREPDSNTKYELDTPPVNGRANPFSAYKGYNDGENTAAGGKDREVPAKVHDPNFYLILNTYTDNAPKVIMGEYPRPETEIYANANNTVKGKLTLSVDKGKYVYSYTIGNTTRQDEKPLLLDDGIIRMEVISQPRKSAEDKSGIIMDIENKTGLPLEITVKNDDKNAPRFNIGNKSGEVNVRVGNGE